MSLLLVRVYTAFPLSTIRGEDHFTKPGIQGPADVSLGFVYKTVPHVTLKSIANNPEIGRAHV